jgi:hypothetical protein
MPAQLDRCLAEGNWLISGPISARMLAAVISFTPGTLCANMTETPSVTAISEQGGKENQHGNDERFCPARGSGYGNTGVSYR